MFGSFFIGQVFFGQEPVVPVRTIQYILVKDGSVTVNARFSYKTSIYSNFRHTVM